MLEDQLAADTKEALLAGDSRRVTTLRGLKATILNAKVAAGTRDQAMPDAEVQAILAKEAKKRQESADLYVQGGNQASADLELYEKGLIESYLPAPLTEEELIVLIDEVIASGTTAMGPVIGAVKAKAGPGADGALLAKLVRERLAQ